MLGEEARQLARKQEGVGFPPFSEFCLFVKKEARISCNPVTSPHALKGDEKEDHGRNGMSARHRKPPEVGAFTTGVQDSNESSQEKSEPKINMCLLCKSEHELDNCVRFARLPLPERRQFVQSQALCQGCLKWGHVSKECHGRKLCKIWNKCHLTSLRDKKG